MFDRTKLTMFVRSALLRRALGLRLLPSEAGGCVEATTVLGNTVRQRRNLHTSGEHISDSNCCVMMGVTF